MLDIRVQLIIDSDFKAEYRHNMTLLLEKLQEIVAAQTTAATTEAETKQQLLAAIANETEQVSLLLSNLKEVITAQNTQIDQLLAELAGQQISREAQDLLGQLLSNAQSSAVTLDDAITAIDSISEA